MEKVDEIVNGVKSGKKEVVIAGDINAKSQLWGSPTIDKKGEHWSEWIAALNLIVQNTGLTIDKKGEHWSEWIAALNLVLQLSIKKANTGLSGLRL
ncbi:Endonuclease-reverse transcriptase [Popillia japonica]|uniref:Endonuclease-reverse transcriptase n=1 Tax=Popillia japonica TaxID=7064 RepID=A0AAW1LV43_POPJA